MVLERKTEPEFRMGPSRKKQKIGGPISLFFATRGSKTDPKMDPEIHKKRFLAYYFINKKTAKFQKHFFSIFLLSGRPGPSKSRQNAVLSFKIEGTTVS